MSDAVQKEGGWEITGLTAREVFAIRAAFELAYDTNETDEPYPGLADAYAKVTVVADQVSARGYEPKPETSAQSQAYIDGATPWRYDADGAEDAADGDDEGCPKGDPDCDGPDDGCHDACEDGTLDEAVRSAEAFSDDDTDGVLGALNAQYPPEHEAPSADATGAR